MKQITYDTLSVPGVPFLHLLELHMEQKVNEHAEAFLTGEAEPAAAQDFIAHTTEHDVYKIMDQERILFCGLISNAKIQYQSEAAVLELKMESATRMLDSRYEKHSYQNSSYTYSQVMKLVAKDIGTIHFLGRDKRIPGIIMQYEETAWQFIKRMAAECGSSIFPDITSVTPALYVGMKKTEAPAGNQTEQGNFTAGGNTEAFIYAGSMLGGKCVTRVTSVLEGGVLKSNYETAAPAKVPVPNVRAQGRGQFAGRVFSGIVQGGGTRSGTGTSDRY